MDLHEAAKRGRGLGERARGRGGGVSENSEFFLGFVLKGCDIRVPSRAFFGGFGDLGFGVSSFGSGGFFGGQSAWKKRPGSFGSSRVLRFLPVAGFGSPRPLFRGILQL